MRPKPFCETEGDLEGKALVTTMHYSLAEAETETRGDTLRDVETEASANTLAVRVAQVKAEKVRHITCLNDGRHVGRDGVQDVWQNND